MSPDTAPVKEGGVTWLALFASTGTLVCCALPIMLVSLGMGATVAALTSSFPFLVTLSLQKTGVFAGSGLMLALTAWLIRRPGRVCPADPELNRMCNKARTWNRRIYLISVLIWSIGFFAAFLALPLRIWLDS